MAGIGLLAGAQLTPREQLTPLTSKAMEGVEHTAYNFKVADGDTLQLDVFIDPSATPALDGKRPILFYSFGGGWQGGDKFYGTSDKINLLPYFAHKGWVAVCYDYRLGFLRARKSGQIDDLDFVQFVIDGRFGDADVWGAVQQSIDLALDDSADALNFVFKHAPEWDADTACMVATGGSAGAINMLTLENLICNGSRPDITDRLPADFNFKALIPMAGGVWYTGDGAPRWNKKPCPTLFFHGDADGLVPYDAVEYPKSNGKAWGSHAVAAQFKEMGVPYQMYTITGGDHAWANHPVVFNRGDMDRFLERVLFGGETLMLDTVESGTDHNTMWYIEYMK